MQKEEKAKRINKKYSYEFKLSVILDMTKNNLGYFELIRKYWGDDVNPHSHVGHLKVWERIYLEEGV
ncbi:MAG: hypothetical protein RR327_07205, partial [Clostridia bacterium]